MTILLHSIEIFNLLAKMFKFMIFRNAYRLQAQISSRIKLRGVAFQNKGMAMTRFETKWEYYDAK